MKFKFKYHLLKNDTLVIDCQVMYLMVWYAFRAKECNPEEHLVLEKPW